MLAANDPRNVLKPAPWSRRASRVAQNEAPPLCRQAADLKSFSPVETICFELNGKLRLTRRHQSRGKPLSSLRVKKTTAKPEISDQIGRQLRSVYNDMLAQPVPDRFLDLLKDLDAIPGLSRADAGMEKKAAK